MRKILLGALLLLSFKASAEFKTEVDRFSGSTEHSYTGPSFPAPPAGQFKLSMHKTQQPGKDDAQFMFLIRTGSNWRYLRCESVRWLRDGQPFDFVEPTFQRDTMRGGVIEGLIFILTPEQHAQLASASTLELKICNDELAIPAADIDGIRQVHQAGR